MYVEEAIKELKAAIVNEIYNEFWYNIQNLGGPGLHSENEINRQEVLDTLKRTRDKIVDKL
jgi:hypothetical protein